MAEQKFYIDPVNGNDGWDGTAKTYQSGTIGPWATIQHAADTANPSNGLPIYIYCRQGTYTLTSRIEADTFSGRATDRRINYVGDYKGDVWEDGEGAVKLTGYGFYINHSYVGQGYFAIKGFEITGTTVYEPIFIQLAADIVVEENFIHDCALTQPFGYVGGINVYLCSNFTARNNIIANISANPITCGIVCRQHSVTSSFDVESNTIHNISSTSSFGICAYFYRTYNIYSISVTLKSNILSKAVGGSWGSLLYINNGLGGNPANDFFFQGDYDQFYKNGADYVSVLKNGGPYYYTTFADWQSNPYFPGPFLEPQDKNGQEGNPLLLSVSGTSKDDYKLVVESPCIEKGFPYPLFPTDGWGNARRFGQFPDIGAHEYTDVPPAPSEVFLSDLTTNSLVLHFTRPALTTYTTGYIEIEQSTNGIDFIKIDQVRPITDPPEMTYVVTGLLPDTRYYYRVRATNELGDGGYSITVSALTLMPKTLGVRAEDTPEDQGGSINVYWNTSNSLNFQSYKVYVETSYFETVEGLTSKKTVTSQVTGFTAVTGLTNNVGYFVAVTPVNIEGNENKVLV